MPVRFDQLASAPARALQIYLILIGCAANQQVITYAGLLTAQAFSHPRGADWRFTTKDARVELKSLYPFTLNESDH